MIGGHDIRLLPSAVVVWGVSAWLTTQGSTPSVLVATVAVVVSVAALGRWRPVALVAGCLAVVAVSCAWRTAVAESSPLNDLAERHRSGIFELSVSRDAIGFDQRGVPQAVVQVTIRRAEVSGQRVRDAGRATAFIEGDASDLVVGRQFTAVARLSPSDHSREVAVLDVTRRGDVAAGATWWEGAERLREGMRDAAVPLSPRPRALLPALVNGDDARVDAEMETDFQRSGLTHLMAVSGTNLTIVLGVMLALVRGLGLGRRSVLWVVGGLTVGAFVLMARPDPSVVRAAAMGIVGVAALGFGRSGGVRALSLAVIALLFLDPWIGRSPGFVLSVCATAGILLLAPLLADRLGQWMPRWAALAVAIPIAAQLACTPALTAISQQVSAVSVLANVLAAPAVAPATVLGLAAGIVAVPLPAVGQLVAQPAGWCAAWIVAVAHRSAALDGASVAWSAPWQLMLVLAPVATALVLALASRPVLATGLVLGLLAATVRPPSPGWPPQGWVMVACDVGQGDGTVVRAGPSTVVLVDAGPDPTAIDGCLDRLGVDHIALAIFTHGHADHTAGWSGARRGRAVDRVAVGPSGGPVGEDAGALLLQAGSTFSVGDVRAEVIWPTDPEDVSESADGSTLNDASIVLRVQVRGVDLLLTGDVEPDAQDAIVRSGVPLSADVLKMPHHGSARQSPRFFEAVDARIATISSGEDNDYGHPAGAALALLRDGDTRVWRTDQDGDVAVVEHDGQMRVVTRR